MKKLISELSRRHVFRVTGAYVILAWIALQVINNLAPAVALPEWTSALLVVILIAGLPIVVLTAWAFELTPDGIKKSSDHTEEGATKPIDVVLMVLSALILVVFVVSLFRGPPKLATEQTPMTVAEETQEIDEIVGPPVLSVAVLPFADMSPEGDQDWFSDGISEEIIHRLAQEEELTVAGRTSSFYFKGKNVPFDEIGEILNVSTVLEGSVRKVGDRVRITGQLIDIETGAHRWSGVYDRELEDIFRIQEDLSVAIAQEMLREMGVETSLSNYETYEPNLEAYQTYLRARQVWNNLSTEGTTRGARLLKKSSELDEGYVMPLLLLLNLIAYNEGYLLAESELYDFESLYQEAMSRQPSDIEALHLKATHALYNWRFVQADDYFAQIEKILNLPLEFRQLPAFFYISTLRVEKGVQILEELHRFSPLDGMIRMWLMIGYAALEQPEKTLAIFDETRSLGIPLSQVHWATAASAALMQGDFRTYQEYIATAAEHPDDFSNWRRIAETESVLSSGDKQEIANLEAKYKSEFEKTNNLGLLVYLLNFAIAQGDEARSLSLLTTIFEERPLNFVFSMIGSNEATVDFMVNNERAREIATREAFRFEWLAGEQAESQ
jgi:TolB-like protein